MSNPEGTLPQGAFTGLDAFQQLVRDALAAAAAQGWMEMVWCDATFEDWPLRERAVVDSLNAWARGGRKLTLIAHRFEVLQRTHHRFVDWRIRWDHLLECRVSKVKDASEFPSVLWSPAWTLQRMDLVRNTGVTGSEPQRKVRLAEQLQELRRHSSPGFPATTLGL